MLLRKTKERIAVRCMRSEPPGRASERYRSAPHSGSGHPGAPRMPTFARRRPAMKPSPNASDQAMASFLFGIQEPFLFPHEEREMGLELHFFPRTGKKRFFKYAAHPMRTCRKYAAVPLCPFFIFPERKELPHPKGWGSLPFVGPSGSFAYPAYLAAALAPARRPEVRDQPCAQPP